MAAVESVSAGVETTAQEGDIIQITKPRVMV